MDRRQFLAALGAAGVAGCTGGDDAGTPPPTETRTPISTATTTPPPSPTASPTPTATPRPAVDASRVALLYRFDDFGDVAENAIDSAGRGVPIILGGRFTLYARDGEVDGLAQFTVRDADGRRQTQQQAPVSELVSEDSAYQYEQTVVVDTSGWEIGTYTVEMIAQDRQTGYVSDPVTAEFRLLSPLTETQATLESVETPGRVQVGEPYQFTLTVGNRSAEANSIRSSLSVRTELSDWFTYSDEDALIELTIPAGGTNTWQSGETAFNQAGEFTFRLDAVGGTWTVTVTES